VIAKAELLTNIKKLPTFSTTVVRLSSILNDPDATVGEFESIILPDVALTANLLRLANSAFFGLPRRIGSTREAITLLGMKRVYELGAMAAIEAVVPDRLPGYGIDAASYWCHSVAVAVLSERLSKDRKLIAPALTFTAGLMHDIGKLVISQFLAEAQAALHQEMTGNNKSLVESEREVLGTDHCEVGADIARAWNLPDEVALVATAHHDPDELNQGKGDIMVDLVHIADCVAHSLGFGADVGELRRTLRVAALERLGLKATDLERVVSRSMSEIEGLAQFSRAAGRGGAT
jgi:putative nucleotidyltransferase with HDIG domain